MEETEEILDIIISEFHNRCLIVELFETCSNTISLIYLRNLKLVIMLLQESL